MPFHNPSLLPCSLWSGLLFHLSFSSLKPEQNGTHKPPPRPTHAHTRTHAHTHTHAHTCTHSLPGFLLSSGWPPTYSPPLRPQLSVTTQISALLLSSATCRPLVCPVLTLSGLPASARSGWFPDKWLGGTDPGGLSPPPTNKLKTPKLVAPALSTDGFESWKNRGLF